MTSVIRLTATLQDGTIYLEGALDGLAQIAPQILESGPVLKLNLEKVKSVNSLGITHWIHFLESRKCKIVELHQCPPPFIDAANMISSVTAPKAVTVTIVSMQVPYYCGKCQQDSLLLVRRDEITVAGGVITIPKKPCAHCGQPAAEGLDPSDYLGFLLDEN